MGDFAKLEAFRALVFAGIKRALELDNHHKSAEGAISVYMPSYFGSGYVIGLYCYILGPSRRYEWEGATLGDAVDKATADVTKWIAEMEADYAE